MLFKSIEFTEEEKKMLARHGRPPVDEAEERRVLKKRIRSREGQAKLRKKWAKQRAKKKEVLLKEAKKLAVDILKGKVTVDGTDFAKPPAPVPQPVAVIQPEEIQTRRPPGRPSHIRYSNLAVEVARLSEVDVRIVDKVFKSMGQAVLNLFERADKVLLLPGLGKIEYRFVLGGRFSLHLRPLIGWRDKLEQIVGRPVRWKEHYRDAVERRRLMLAERAEALGMEPAFTDNPVLVIVPDHSQKAKAAARRAARAAAKLLKKSSRRKSAGRSEW